MATDQTHHTTPDAQPQSLQTRDSRLQTACDIFNTILPDWEIQGDPTLDLTPTHVDYDETLHKSYGRCGPRQNGRVFLRLNKDYITNPGNSLEHKLCLLVHEFAHAVDIPVNTSTHYRPTHTGDFYTAFATLAERTVKHKHTIETTLGASINWTQFLHEVTRNPKAHQIDSRSTTTHETRHELVERLGSATSLDPFSGMHFRIEGKQSKSKPHYRSIALSDLQYEHKTMREMMDWWRTHDQKDHISLLNGAYCVNTLFVNPNGDGTYIAKNDYAATALSHVINTTDLTSFTVHVR